MVADNGEEGLDGIVVGYGFGSCILDLVCPFPCLYHIVDIGLYGGDSDLPISAASSREPVGLLPV